MVKTPASPNPKTTPVEKQTAKPAMARMAVTIHGYEYIVGCDVGDEKKLADIVKLVDNKLTSIASGSPSASETRLFMLTCLLLADELVETRKALKEARKADEDLMVAAVDHLRQRVIGIAQQIGE